MNSVRDMLPRETAMRALKIIEPHFRRQEFLKPAIAHSLMDKLGCSRATAYRLIDSAMDVCGVYLTDARTVRRVQSRAGESTTENVHLTGRQP